MSVKSMGCLFVPFVLVIRCCCLPTVLCVYLQIERIKHSLPKNANKTITCNGKSSQHLHQSMPYGCYHLSLITLLMGCFSLSFLRKLSPSECLKTSQSVIYKNTLYSIVSHKIFCQASVNRCVDS